MLGLLYVQLDLKQVKEIMGRSLAPSSGSAPHVLDAPEGDIALIFSELVSPACCYPATQPACADAMLLQMLDRSLS
jgi:hypothetical protein